MKNTKSWWVSAMFRTILPDKDYPHNPVPGKTVRLKTAWIAVIAVYLCVSTTPVAAESPFELEPRREWILLGTGAALGVTTLALISQVDRLTLDEIATLDINNVNSFDRRDMEPYRETAAGDALLYTSYLLPLTFLTYEDTRKDWQTLGVMWIQTVLLQTGLNGIVKASVLRTRPYVYDPETPIDVKTSKSARFSFYSGHTAATAANSFFVARVFQEYLASGKAKALIWTGAVIYPAFTAYMRRESGHHWRTDVMTGYTVGALIGYLVPQLHLTDKGRRVSLQPVSSSSGGAGVAVNVTF
jgi:membrane-associated phospholipid phosphatase